jgi:hypothetical protein
MLDLPAVHAELRRRLSVHEDVFLVSDNLTDANTAAGRKVDEPSPDTYVLLGAPTDRYPDGQLFASVRTGKRYVSYHLMSVYLSPEEPSISPELTRRRQGKSCFNFTRIDDALFDELADLTDRGRDLYEAAGLLRR